MCLAGDLRGLGGAWAAPLSTSSSLLEGAVGHIRRGENVREGWARIRDASGIELMGGSVSAWAIQHCEDNRYYSRETRQSSPLRPRDWF